METQSSTESRTAANRRPPGDARASKNERLCDLTEALRVDRDPTAGGAVPSGSRADDTGRDDRSPSPEAVREQLDRILASGEFVAPDRLKSFLRFAVEETLAGRAERLKAYTIAVDVFGRDESFDPQTDPVVRMEAGRLRRRLERYYLAAGTTDPVRIEIPRAPTRRRSSCTMLAQGRKAPAWAGPQGRAGALRGMLSRAWAGRWRSG